MIVQTIEISMSKGRAADILAHVGEEGREIEFIPDVELSADDHTAEIDTVKPDGTFTMTSCSINENGHIIAPITEQAVAVKGLCHYIIKVYNDDLVIYSACGSLWVDDHLITDDMIESVAEVNGYRFPQDFFTIHDIEPNPDGVTTETLEKLRVFNTMYAISGYHPSKIKNGNPIEFYDGADAPLVKCVSAITGYQQGSGTPSPDNIRPIVAYTEGKIDVRNGDGNVTTHTTTYPSAIYRGSEDVVKGTVECEKKKITISSGIVLYGNYGVDDAQLFYWNQPLSDIAPYSEVESPSQNRPICNFYEAITQSNQYYMKDFEFRTNTSLATSNRFYFRDSRFSTAEEFNAYIANNPIEIAYPLATPTTSPVTPTNLPIKSLYGYNHIESTTGEINLEYITDIFQPLVKSIEQLI